MFLRTYNRMIAHGGGNSDASKCLQLLFLELFPFSLLV